MGNIEGQDETTYAPLAIDEEGGVVVMEGVYENGFGIVANTAMRDSRPGMTVTAKAIYAYLVSFSGAGKNVAFPSRSRILSELGISKDTYYKHRAALVRYGYIKVMQEPSSGRHYANNFYVINQTVPGLTSVTESAKVINIPGVFNNLQVAPCPISSDTENSLEPNYSPNRPCPKISDTESVAKPQVAPCPISSDTENQDTNKIDRYIDKSKGGQADEVDVDSATDALLRHSIRDGEDRDATRTAYQDALAEGFTTEQVEEAYDSYARVYRATHDTPSRVMYMHNFLSKHNGLHFYATKPAETSCGGFKAPTVEQVADYVAEKGYEVDPETFVAYYDARDWCFPNGQKMKKWKSAVVTWHRKEVTDADAAKARAHKAQKATRKPKVDTSVFDIYDKAMHG